jgi:hypothetical protein
MDDRLKKALEFSNYQYNLTNQRKILREKFSSRLIYGYAGGIFTVDQQLISFVQFLISQGKSKDIPLIDSNQNPILIDNLESFLSEILSIYFSAVLEYYNEYEKIKKSRTVEKLIGYNE